MATTLQEIIGYRNLTGIISDPKGGVPDDILPPSFMTITRRIVGHTCVYKKISGTRTTARISTYGRASQRMQLRGIEDKPIKLLHSIHNVSHDMAVLAQLENYDNPQIQQLGKAEIARQTADFRQKFVNLRLSCIYSTLAKGAIYYDGDGELLPSSSGAVVTVDWGVDDDNKDQLNGIISASWATDSTDILGQLVEIKQTARQTTGYQIKHAFYGKNIPEYLVSNDSIANLVNGNPAYAQAMLQGDIPPICNIQWHPAYDAFYEDKDGTIQEWFGDDTVVFTPDPSPDWFEGIEGSYCVPRNVNIGSDANSVVSSSFATVNGMFSYAYPTKDPAGIKHVAGDTFIYCLKVPNAIFIADVTP